MKKMGIGIDVASEKLDVCVLIDDKPQFKRFPNNVDGFAACLKWLRGIRPDDLQFVFEPTGRYGELLVKFMHGSGCVPLQAQPFEVSRYAEGLNMRVKSDQKDSYALARYCIERPDKCRKWLPKTDDGYELRDLQMLLKSKVKRVIALRAQLKCKLYSDFAKRDIEQELAQLEQSRITILSRAEKIILQNSVLSTDLALLMDIPGIGKQTAIMLLTLIDFRAFSSARALAAFLGLTGRMDDSGKLVAKSNPISKRGSSYIRSQLFMPARSMRQHDEATEKFARGLKERGKHDWLVQAAVVRRMVTIAWAVIVKRQPFDRSYVHPLVY
jgi:transposase